MLTWFQKASLAFLTSLVVLTIAAILLVYFGMGDRVLEVRIVRPPQDTNPALVLSPADTTAADLAPTDTVTPTLTCTASPTPTTQSVEPSDTPTRPRSTETPSPSSIPRSFPSATPTPARTAKVAAAKIPAPSPTPETYDGIEAQAVVLINQARQAAGTAALARDPALDEIARDRSQDMAMRHYFSHEDPAGGTLPLEKLLNERHVDYLQAGENIAYFLGRVQVDALPKLSTEKWLQSPPHKENLLDPTYNVTGFGIARVETSEGTMWYLTQVFVQR